MQNLKDNTECILITIFGDLSSKIDINQGYTCTDMEVSKYLDVRILNATETTPITSDEDIKLEVTDSDKTLPITSTITIKGAIVLVVMNTFDLFMYVLITKSILNHMMVWQCLMSAVIYFDQIIARLKIMSGTAKIDSIQEAFGPDNETKNVMDHTKNMICSNFELILKSSAGEITGVTLCD